MMKALIFAKESERLPHKHLLEICGEPMLSRINRILTETRLFDEVLIYSKYRELRLEGVTIVWDSSEGVLLDSIILAVSQYDEFFAIGGDMPLIDGSVISKMLNVYDGMPIAALDFQNIVEPLFAIYNQKIYDDIREYSKNGRKIFPFIEERFKMIRMDARESKKLFNVNTMEDFERAKGAIDCDQHISNP